MGQRRNTRGRLVAPLWTAIRVHIVMAIGTARGSGWREYCSTGALLAIVVECASRMACIPAQCLGVSHTLTQRHMMSPVPSSLKVSFIN